MTPFLIGVVLALAVGVMGTVVGFDRERAFYCTALIVIGFLYSLFAVMGGSMRALGLEVAVGALFLALAILGFRGSLWLVVAGLAGHGVFDLLHPRLITNPGVPAFWPAFCGAYDIAAAAYLGWLLQARRLRATA